MKKEEIDILYDFANNEQTYYCYDWHGFEYEIILPLINKAIKEIKEKNKIIKDTRKYIKNNIVEDDNGCGEYWRAIYDDDIDKLLEMLK